MPNWTRNTPWRQGSLLTVETAKAVNVLHPEDPDGSVVIVATHNCDLAQLPDKESLMSRLLLVEKFINSMATIRMQNLQELST